MAWGGKLVDLELDDESKLDAVMPIAMPDRPDYPYGLRISLTEKELAKLNLEPDCNVGDLVDMRCFGVVTSVSIDQRNGEQTCRVEIQIQRMAISDEMRDDEDED
jgi:hypothetical protein